MQEILRDPSLIHADAASSGSATYVAGQSLCVKHPSSWPQPAAGERFVGLPSLVRSKMPATSSSRSARTMAVLPRLIRPLLATLRRSPPADQDRYGWGVQMGRGCAIAYVSGADVRLVSRNDKDIAASYPELAVLADRVDAL
jgi:hypothetical protein